MKGGKIFPQKIPPSAMAEPECVICGDALQDHQRFTCPDNSEHGQCQSCFQAYIQFCCANYAVQKTIPLHCSMCEYAIPEADLLRLLGQEDLDLYTKTQLRVAMEDSTDEVPITCSSCHAYTEMYIPAGPDDWDETLLERARIRHVQAWGKELEMRKQAPEHTPAELQALLDRIRDKQEVVHMNTGTRPKEPEEITNEQVQEYSSLYSRDALVLLLDFDEDAVDYDEYKYVEEALEFQSLVVRAALAECSNQVVVELGERSYTEDTTSMFFMCRDVMCDGAYCLHCQSLLRKENMGTHVCIKDEVDMLYHTLIDAMAANGSRKCPECGYGGKKDFACSHITCDMCSTKWCYVCGLKEDDVEGEGFSIHNDWTLDGPGGRCPMYLQHKYGDRKIGDEMMDGDPELALETFHRELQSQAVDQLKDKTEPGLWTKMIDKYYPEGVVLPDLPVLTWKRRNKPLANEVNALFQFLLFFALIFGFAGVYIYIISVGADSDDTPCSRGIPSYLIVHGSLGVVLTAFLVSQCAVGSFLNRGIENRCMEVYIASQGVCLTLLALAMFSTWIWGMVLTYSTSLEECSDHAYRVALWFQGAIWVVLGMYMCVCPCLMCGWVKWWNSP